MPIGMGLFAVWVKRFYWPPGRAPLSEAESPRYDFLPRRSNPPPANALRLNEAPGG